MNYFIGIDGGGTKTEALLLREDGIVLGRGISGPSNPLFVSKEDAFSAVADSMNQAVGNLVTGKESGEASIKFVASVCIPGMRKYRAELENVLSELCGKIYVDADEMNAFLGALAKPYGIVVVSGTGSFGMGINRKGERSDIGGWGPILGDEGSGYHIGLSSLKAVIGEYEDDGPATVLTRKITDYLKIEGIGELRRLIYSKDFDRSRMGDLGKLVKKAAEEGDAVSLGIIDKAAFELSRLAVKVIGKLKMDDGIYNAVLTGGVRKFGDLVIKPFTGYLHESAANVIVKDPESEPVVGAALIAMKESGIDIMDEVLLKNLRKSYDGVLKA